MSSEVQALLSVVRLKKNTLPKEFVGIMLEMIVDCNSRHGNPKILPCTTNLQLGFGRNKLSSSLRMGQNTLVSLPGKFITALICLTFFNIVLISISIDQELH